MTKACHAKLSERFVGQFRQKVYVDVIGLEAWAYWPMPWDSSQCRILLIAAILVGNHRLLALEIGEEYQNAMDPC